MHVHTHVLQAWPLSQLLAHEEIPPAKRWYAREYMYSLYEEACEREMFRAGDETYAMELEDELARLASMS